VENKTVLFCSLAPVLVFLPMQNAGTDYKKLYQESLEKLARAEAQNALTLQQASNYQEQVTLLTHQVNGYEQQVSGYQQQVSSYEQQILLLKHVLPAQPLAWCSRKTWSERR
jgi:uncharacterized protein YlxW (UPF0749 family)